MQAPSAADTNRLTEVLRVIHSFDPCLSCAVHMVRPGRDGQSLVIHAAPAAI